MFKFNVPKEICDALFGQDHNASLEEGTDDLKRLKTVVRQLLIESIDDDVSLTSINQRHAGNAIRLPLPAKYTRSIKRLSKSLGVSDGLACQNLLDLAVIKGSLTEHIDTTGANALNPYLKALKYQKKPPQMLFYQHISNIPYGKIAFVESSTGTGKTLSMLASALEQAKAADDAILIAVPSKVLIKQFEGLYDRLLTKMKLPPIYTIYGRTNFVAISRLKDAITSEPEVFGEAIDDVKRWLSDNKTHGGMVEDLALVTPLAPHYTLTRYDIDDPSERLYKVQFEEKNQASVVVTTHAMLSSHIKKYRYNENKIDGMRDIKNVHYEQLSPLYESLKTLPKHSPEYTSTIKEINETVDAYVKTKAEMIDQEEGLLPDFETVIIDEAHMFHESMTLIFNGMVSLRAMVRLLTELSLNGLATKASLERLLLIMEKINGKQKHTDEQEISLFDGSEKGQILGSLLNDFARVCERGILKRARRDIRAQTLIADCRILQQINLRVKKYHQHVYFEASPVRGYPRVHFKRESLRSEYEMLWGTTPKVTLVSATLFTRQLSGETTTYLRKKMFIPHDRAIDYPPIRPEWINKSVKACYLPTVNHRDLTLALAKHSKTEKKQMREQERFYLAAALVMNRYIKNSAGGSLVLCTSYHGIETIRNNLITTKPIIYAQKNLTIARQKELFCQASLDGEKPIWLALGSAWAGLDINGEHYGLGVNNDNLLTDLWIPKIPLQKDNGKVSYADVVLDAALRFKQGVGRLVRREGLPPNRRIFVLDGRLTDPERKSFMATVRYMLTPYKIKEIDSTND